MNSDRKPYPIVHLYTSHMEHETQVVACNVDGLAALRKLVETGQPQECFTADGEGFALKLVTADDATMQTLPLPYAEQERHIFRADEWQELRRLVEAGENAVKGGDPASRLTRVAAILREHYSPYRGETDAKFVAGLERHAETGPDRVLSEQIDAAWEEVGGRE